MSPGNTVGYHAANYTKRVLEGIQEECDHKRFILESEIFNNKLIWGFTLDYLKTIDSLGWESWFDGPALPEIILWTGSEFQTVLRILWDRIWYIKGNLTK